MAEELTPAQIEHARRVQASKDEMRARQERSQQGMNRGREASQADHAERVQRSKDEMQAGQERSLQGMMRGRGPGAPPISYDAEKFYGPVAMASLAIEPKGGPLYKEVLKKFGGAIVAAVLNSPNGCGEVTLNPGALNPKPTIVTGNLCRVEDPTAFYGFDINLAPGAQFQIIHPAPGR